MVARQPDGGEVLGRLDVVDCLLLILKRDKQMAKPYSNICKNGFCSRCGWGDTIGGQQVADDPV